MENQKKLYRSVTNRVIGGVAGGLSEYFDIDVVIVRLLFVMLLLFSGGGLLAYIILWIVVPGRPVLPEKNPVGNTDGTQVQNETSNIQQKTSRSVIAGIKLICGPIPIIFYLTGILILSFYPITKTYYDEMISKARSRSFSEYGIDTISEVDT